MGFKVAVAVIKENNIFTEKPVEVVKTESHMERIGDIQPETTGYVTLNMLVLIASRNFKMLVLFSDKRLREPETIDFSITTQPHELQSFTDQVIRIDVVGIHTGTVTIKGHPPIPGNQGGIINAVAHHAPDLEFRPSVVVVNIGGRPETILAGVDRTEVVVIDTAIQPE